MYLREGYQHEAPAEDAPPEATGREWELTPGRVVLRRHDREIETVNWALADELFSSADAYLHPTGLETLTCPACTEGFTFRGRWGGPVTLACPCGFEETVGEEWGRHLLQRLILSATDPAYEARRLVVLVDAERAARRLVPRGPGDPDVALAVVVDGAADSLAAELARALRPRLPERHTGSRMMLLLLEVALALEVAEVQESSDGAQLTEATRTLLRDARDVSGLR